MTVHYPMFVLATLASMEVICVVIMLLHLFRKFLMRRVFLITVAAINTIGCVVIGLLVQLNWYEILVAAIAVTIVAMIWFVMVLYGFEWVDKFIKNSLKNDGIKK